MHFPAANLRSLLIEEKVEKFLDKYRIIIGIYGVYTASLTHRVYHTLEVVEGLRGVVTSISEATFKCGFRIPTLPILKRLFDDMGIALGQIDSYI